MIYGAAGDRNMERLIRFLARSPVVPVARRRDGRSSSRCTSRISAARPSTRCCAEAAARTGVQPRGANPAPLRELVAHVAGLLGRKPLLVSVPVRPVAAALRVWRALRLPPRLTPEQVLRLAEDKAFPYEDARRDWGYAPRGWREGLAAEVAALRATPARPA